MLVWDIHYTAHSVEKATSGSVFVAETSLRKGVQMFNEKETDEGSGGLSGVELGLNQS